MTGSEPGLPEPGLPEPGAGPPAGAESQLRERHRVAEAGGGRETACRHSTPLDRALGNDSDGAFYRTCVLPCKTIFFF